MAELTAIGWVLSPMIKKMMDKIPSYIMGRYHRDSDMEKDLEKLRVTLLQIQVVVDKAKGWQTMDDSQKQLLRYLREAIYEADDLLDEFEYQDMKEQAEAAEGTVSHVVSSSVEVGKRLFIDKLRNNLTEILKKFEDVKKTADFVVNLTRADRNSAVEQVQINSSRVTTSILAKNKIVGRDKERDEIVSLLLKSTTDEPESSYTNIPVISIIGNGGIGKTTLAQIIYNDQRIKDQFPLRMWICVSDNFDEMKLTKEILECASVSDEKLESKRNLNMLQEKLQNKLKLKRFLLVLDDVWLDEKKGKYQNEEMWMKLLIPLQGGARGSKIIVTTRMEIVATIFGVTNLIFLKGLTKDDMWSLLKRHAFGNENLDNHPELKEISLQIAERMKGSPLACKVVGSMLRGILDATKWKEILEKEMADDIISILRLSYQRLPYHLKQCFAYCSIFPKDWHFEVKKLVLLWIAQDYIEIPARNDRPLVDIGMDYFNELLRRSFFQKVDRNFGTYHVIHDLMHDLAESVSMDECFRIDHGKQRKIMQPVQHLGVVMNVGGEIRDFVSQLEKTSNFKNLRTLIFFKISYMELSLPLNIFKELKSLRVLDFGRNALWRGIVSESIGNLTHLRYLYLHDLTNFLSELSCKLYHLQVLGADEELSFCGSMTKLIKFGKLTRLDVPTLRFRVEKKGGQSIGVLKGLAVVLRGKLQISHLENVTGKEEAIEADLGSMQHLEGLQLRWSSEPRIKWSQERDEEVAEALKPYPNLKWLVIDGFRGIRYPSWLGMINLQTIHLFNCSCLEVLPPLGHLPSLKDLIIWKMDAVKGVGREFYGVVDDSDGVRGFPSLEVLEFQDMREWLEWCGADFPVFPRLRRLVVEECPKLMRFPRFPPTLTNIYISTPLIYHMNMKPLHLQSSSKPFLLELERSIVPPSTLLHDNILAAIEELEITDCTEPMPAGCFDKLAALRHLKLNGCQESLATDVLPASLESLMFNDCRVTDRWVSRCLHSLTHLSDLTILRCKELTSLGALHCLPSLKYLYLHDCPQLKSLPEEGLPASIEVLVLSNCHPALMQQMREKKGPEWDKIAHIPGIEID